jgi:hypothetical protein
VSDIRCDIFDYKRDSLVDQRGLFKDAFPERVGTETANESHYFWKFHSFPNTPDSYEYSAYHENKMVGYYAALPYHYIINGKEMICGMVCDVMTHSSMRGKGVFTTIGRYATDDLKNKGLHFTSGYPIRPEVIPGHIKVGWVTTFQMPLYIKILKVNSILSKWNFSFVSSLINPFIKMMSLYKVSCTNKSFGCEIYEVNEIDNIARYEEFFLKWSSKQTHYLIKNKSFLKWRLSAPAKDYRIICIRKDGNIVATAIISFSDVKGVPSIGILDLMVLDGHYSAIKYLFKELEVMAEAKKSEAIIGMFCKHWANRYGFVKCGMMKTNIKFTLILKQLDPSIDFVSIKNENNWNLTWIDSDNL